MTVEKVSTLIEGDFGIWYSEERPPEHFWQFRRDLDADETLETNISSKWAIVLSALMEHSEEVQGTVS
jgi:hypothetical protein